MKKTYILTSFLLSLFIAGSSYGEGVEIPDSMEIQSGIGIENDPSQNNDAQIGALQAGAQAGAFLANRACDTCCAPYTPLLADYPPVGNGPPRVFTVTTPVVAPLIGTFNVTSICVSPPAAVRAGIYCSTGAIPKVPNVGINVSWYDGFCVN